MSAKTLFKVILVCFISFSTFSEECKNFSQFRPTTGALSLLNCDFHAEYKERMDAIISTFGKTGGRPVILNLGGKLILKYNDSREEVDVTPDNFHTVKAFLHAFFALYLALPTEDSQSISPDTRNNLLKIQRNLHEAMLEIPSLELTPREQALTRQLANLSENFIASTLKQKNYQKRQLTTYLTSARPLVNAILDDAARIELNALDKTVNRWLAQMPVEDRHKLVIGVAISHQARAKEISLQYFAYKFGYRYGNGAIRENHYVVIEDNFDENSALKALARHYVDRIAAKDIFHRSNRLQKDVLASSATAILNEWKNKKSQY